MTDAVLYAQLDILDFVCDPQVITGLVGVPPTRIVRAGEPVRGRGMVTAKNSRWSYRSPMRSTSLEAAADALASEVRLVEGIVFPPEAYVQLAVIIEGNLRELELGLRSDQVAMLARSKASLDLDVIWGE